jgi:hypothetical protein
LALQPHLPDTHLANEPPHFTPHAPQFGEAFKAVSHPVSATPSQLPNPAGHFRLQLP